MPSVCSSRSPIATSSGIRLPGRDNSIEPPVAAVATVVRRLSLPADLPRSLATHCAEEFANLAALLPELHERFGPTA